MEKKENSVQAMKSTAKNYKSYKVTVKDKTDSLISEMEIAWTPRGETLMFLLLVFVLLLLVRSLMKKPDTSYKLGSGRSTNTTAGVINYTYTTTKK